MTRAPKNREQTGDVAAVVHGEIPAEFVTIASTPAPRYAGVAAKLEQAIAHINAAKRENDRIQGQYPAGSPTWHACETVDDRLHDALAALGD